MPVQSLFVPGAPAVAVLVVAAVSVGMVVEGALLSPSAVVATLDIPMVDSETAGDRAVEELENDGPVVDELELAVSETFVTVDTAKEVLDSFVSTTRAAEATKSQSLATKIWLWLLQQLGPLSTQQNATSSSSKTPAVDVQLYILPNLESVQRLANSVPSLHEPKTRQAKKLTWRTKLWTVGGVPGGICASASHGIWVFVVA